MAVTESTINLDGDDLTAVAVPVHQSPHLRLGFALNSNGSAWTIGQKGRNGQPVSTFLMTAGDTRYLLDLRARTITVVKTGKRYANQYKIDVDAMNDVPVVVGENLRIVFPPTEDSPASYVMTKPIDTVVAMTGATHSAATLADLPSDPTLEALEKELQGREIVTRDGPPESASQITGEADLVHLDGSAPGGATVTFPRRVVVTASDGTQYVGLEWVARGQVVTLNELVKQGETLAVLECENGDTAVLMPNYKGPDGQLGLGISIATKDGRNRDWLAAIGGQNLPIGPGKSAQFYIISRLKDADLRVRGAFELLNVKKMTTLGQPLESDELIPNADYSYALLNHERMRGANKIAADKRAVAPNPGPRLPARALSR